MKYEIINNKPTEGAFIRVPLDIDFHLKSDAFKLLVWLMQHKSGFEVNLYFMKKGTGMDYRTIRKNIDILIDSGKLTISGKSTTSSKLTISYSTIGVVVNLPTNKNIKQEEKSKQEEKQEEIAIEPTTLSQSKASEAKTTGAKTSEALLDFNFIDSNKFHNLI